MAPRDVLAQLDAKVGVPDRRVPPPAWEPPHGPVRRAGLTSVERNGALLLAGALIVGGVISLAVGQSVPAAVFAGPAVGVTVGAAVSLVPPVRRRVQRGSGPVLMLLPPDVTVLDSPPVSRTSVWVVLAVLVATVVALATGSGPTLAFYGVLLLLIPSLQRRQLGEIGRKAGGTVMVLVDTRKARALGGSRLYVLRQPLGLPGKEPRSAPSAIPTQPTHPRPRPRPPYSDLSR